MAKTQPSLVEELAICQNNGCRLIAGVDEAGRGAWAGPLVAAAAILPLPADEQTASWQTLSEQLTGVNDSKLMTATARERLYAVVYQKAQVGVGIVSALTVDYLGVGVANKLAMARAVAALPIKPQFLLLDAFKLPQVALPQKAIVRGDSHSLSIAAASIVAKVTRDRLMRELDAAYPNYGFKTHKGYGTAKHAAALAEFGPCDIHRYSYTPIWEAYESQLHALTT